MHAPKQQGGTRAQDSNHRERGRSVDAPKSARCLLVYYSLAHLTNCIMIHDVRANPRVGTL